MAHLCSRKLMSKKYLPLLLLLLLVPVASFIIFRPAPISSPPATFTQMVSLSITANNKTQTFAENYSASQSAFALLQTVTSKNNLPLTFKQYSFGTLVESINNLKNTKDLAWIYFVNGQSAAIGADQYQVQPGDLIEWKYLKPSF
jgi:hypothetical protein